MVRPAGTARQLRDFWRAAGPQGGGSGGGGGGSPAPAPLMAAACIPLERAQQLVPGLRVPALQQQPGDGAAAEDAALPPQQRQPSKTQQRQRQRQQAQEAQAQEAQGPPDLAAAAALHIPGGVTLHPQRYMAALWRACQRRAAQLPPGSYARLRLGRVASLAELERSRGRHDAVVLAAGAAVGSVAEVGPASLGLDLCQGHSLELAAAAEEEEEAGEGGGGGGGGYPRGAPSVLGPAYLASQGGEVLVVGATQRHGLSAAQAAAECGRAVADAAEARAAAAALLPAAAELWPAAARLPVLRVRWAARRAPCAAAGAPLLCAGSGCLPLSMPAATPLSARRSGVRALPPRSQLGSVPLAGRLPPWLGNREGRPWWLLVGLGARGLVYHGWLGRQLAAAVLAGDEGALDPELRRWQAEEGEGAGGCGGGAAGGGGAAAAPVEGT
jgi:hypothetical protein